METLVKLELKMEIDENAFEALKRVEHHIEELLDLSSYPEIKNIFDVRLSKI